MCINKELDYANISRKSDYSAKICLFFSNDGEDSSVSKLDI